MDYTRYENKLPWVEKPSRPVIPTPTIRNPTSEQFSKYMEECRIYEIELRKYEEGPLKEYREKKKEYAAESVTLLNLFKKECLEDCGLLNHPKAEEIWKVAYREGDGQYSNIYNRVSCIAEVLL